MFDKFTDEMLDLTVTERGLGVGNALPAFPICVVLCISLCCSSSKPVED
jgi:hypothetical protein